MVHNLILFGLPDQKGALHFWLSKQAECPDGLSVPKFNFKQAAVIYQIWLTSLKNSCWIGGNYLTPTPVHKGLPMKCVCMCVYTDLCLHIYMCHTDIERYT